MNKNNMASVFYENQSYFRSLDFGEQSNFPTGKPFNHIKINGRDFNQFNVWIENNVPTTVKEVSNRLTCIIFSSFLWVEKKYEINKRIIGCYYLIHLLHY